MGMAYNYFRVLLKVMTPEEETAMKIIAAYRKTNQQINALGRELNENMLKLQQEVEEIVPEEVKKNPFEKFVLKKEEPITPSKVAFRYSRTVLQELT